jgi:hypothetical protein
MNRRILALLTLALAVGGQLSISVAVAAQRTFVASAGNDANPCSLVLPCRSFGAAISQTAPGGEVIVLDSGGYGPVVITQAVSIVAPAGVYAGVSVLSGTGIVVNAGSGSVVLSGLTITGLGGTTGIDYQSGAALWLERVSASGFSTDTSYGLHASVSVPAKLVIRDSVFSGNFWGAAIAGVSIAVDVERTQFSQNYYGAVFGDNVSGVVSQSSFNGNGASGAYVQPLLSGGVAVLTMRNSVFSANAGHGIVVGHPLNPSLVHVQIIGCEISENDIGIYNGAAGFAYVSDTNVTRNQTGVNGGGTFQDNRLYLNVDDGSFSATVIPKK